MTEYLENVYGEMVRVTEMQEEIKMTILETIENSLESRKARATA